MKFKSLSPVGKSNEGSNSSRIIGKCLYTGKPLNNLADDGKEEGKNTINKCLSDKILRRTDRVVSLKAKHISRKKIFKRSTVKEESELFKKCVNDTRNLCYSKAVQRYKENESKESVIEFVE